ncbi:MAG: diacylglycerol kinase family protein [Acholeplasmataceae bacterium]
MTIILFNPLSSQGLSVNLAKKLGEKLIKENKTVKILNILEIIDVKDFLNGFDEDDEIIIVGGDGTLHRVANKVKDFMIKPKVYMYKAGTGNDFIRTVKVIDNLALINPHLKKLPSLTINNTEQLFINGVGIGLDGMVCYKVNQSKQLKNKSNYFKNAFKSFIESKPFDLDVNIDGKDIKLKKVWLATVMNSKYFGGGMKIAPKKLRDSNDLELVVVKSLPKFLLTLLFPLIYLGLHRFILGAVKFYRGKEISLNTNSTLYMQVDGEDIYPVSEFKTSV